MKRNKRLNCVILKEYRMEALKNLHFMGGWSGYWETRIAGVTYVSERVTGLKYVKGDSGTFIQDAIIDRVRLRRAKEDVSWSYLHDRRFVDNKGNVEWWAW